MNENENYPIAYKVVSFSKKHVEACSKRHLLELEARNWTKEQHKEYRENRKDEPIDMDLIERVVVGWTATRSC